MNPPPQNAVDSLQLLDSLLTSMLEAVTIPFDEKCVNLLAQLVNSNELFVPDDLQAQIMTEVSITGSLTPVTLKKLIECTNMQGGTRTQDLSDQIKYIISHQISPLPKPIYDFLMQSPLSPAIRMILMSKYQSDIAQIPLEIMVDINQEIDRIPDFPLTQDFKDYVSSIMIPLDDHFIVKLNDYFTVSPNSIQTEITDGLTESGGSICMSLLIRLLVTLTLTADPDDCINQFSDTPICVPLCITKALQNMKHKDAPLYLEMFNRDTNMQGGFLTPRQVQALAGIILNSDTEYATTLADECNAFGNLSYVISADLFALLTVFIESGQASTVDAELAPALLSSLQYNQSVPISMLFRLENDLANYPTLTPLRDGITKELDQGSIAVPHDWFKAYAAMKTRPIDDWWRALHHGMMTRKISLELASSIVWCIRKSADPNAQHWKDKMETFVANVTQVFPDTVIHALNLLLSSLPDQPPESFMQQWTKETTTQPVALSFETMLSLQLIIRHHSHFVLDKFVNRIRAQLHRVVFTPTPDFMQLLQDVSTVINLTPEIVNMVETEWNANHIITAFTMKNLRKELRIHTETPVQKLIMQFDTDLNGFKTVPVPIMIQQLISNHITLSDKALARIYRDTKNGLGFSVDTLALIVHELTLVDSDAPRVILQEIMTEPIFHFPVPLTSIFFDMLIQCIDSGQFQLSDELTQQMAVELQSQKNITVLLAIKLKVELDRQKFVRRVPSAPSNEELSTPNAAVPVSGNETHDPALETTLLFDLDFDAPSAIHEPSKYIRYREDMIQLEPYFIVFWQKNEFNLKLIMQRFPRYNFKTVWGWSRKWLHDKNWRPYRERAGYNRRRLNDRGETELFHMGVEASSKHKAWGTAQISADALGLVENPELAGDNRENPVCGPRFVHGFAKRNNLSKKKASTYRRNDKLNMDEMKEFVRKVNEGGDRVGLSHEVNMDEFAVHTVPPLNATYTPVGQTSSQIGVNGNVKEGFTLIGSITADCRTLKPAIIIPDAVSDRSIHTRATIFHSENGWMTGPVCCKYMQFLRDQIGGGTILLIMDTFKGHCTTAVKQKAAELDIELLFVPAGKTGLLQPLDRGVFGPLRSRLNKKLRDAYTANSKVKLTKAKAAEYMIQMWNKVTVDEMIHGWQINVDVETLPGLELLRMVDPNSYYYNNCQNGGHANPYWTNEEEAILIRYINNNNPKPIHWGMFALHSGIRTHTGREIRHRYTFVQQCVNCIAVARTRGVTGGQAVQNAVPQVITGNHDSDDENISNHDYRVYQAYFDDLGVHSIHLQYELTND